MATSMPRTRLLKIVRLRLAARPFSGRACGTLPTAGISPVSIRAPGLLSNMPIQHHPKEVEARVEKGVGEATGHTLRRTGRMHDEQYTVEGAPEVRSGEYFARHRCVQ